MTDFREEAYILEKMEITEDEEDENFTYEEIKDSGDEVDNDSDDNDLNNFDALKAKTNFKMQSRHGGGDSMKTFKMEPKPKTIERDVVIDDFIRNFLSKFKMSKTLNVF
jgi:hypothetical protein